MAAFPSPDVDTEFARALATAAPATDLRPGKPVLLVCDDEEGPRQSLRIVFKDDYHVLLADGGEKALELAREHAIDVAILDIRMAGMSGTEVLYRLKEIDSAIEVIMLTAYETIETARQALRYGACDYLNKPFDIATIRAAVANATERRRLSNEIRQNTEDLKHLKAELEDQRVQEEIARTRGEIYASVIHDINGPLTIMSGFLDMLNQRIGKSVRVEGEDLDFLKDRLSRMTRQVHNCVQVSRRYLSFLRERAESQPPVGVNQILMDLGELLKSNPDAQRNDLKIHLLADDVVARINGTDLMQVLLNLIVNALQCTPEHHRVEIFGQRLLSPFDLSQLVDGPEARFINRDGFDNTPPLLAISVQDDGPGIPPEITPRIFDTYFTTKPHGGTGLGLSIVQRLVREARGCIHLHTKPGHGTTFTVYLPASTATPDRTGA